LARLGKDRRGRRGWARLGRARPGVAGRGTAGTESSVWMANQPVALRGPVTQEVVNMATKKAAEIMITAPDMRIAEFRIIGTAPYVQLKFAEKAINTMQAKMAAGSQSKKGVKREARDFDEDFRQALHRTADGRHGIPAAALRNALISACRVVGFQMTKGKLALFVEADDIDASEGTPLVYIDGEPQPSLHHVRNASGVADLRVRGMWRQWSAMVRVKYDHDMFSVTDITNLLARAGVQVGIGEGRPDSKASAGMGWGTFRLEGMEG